MHEVQFSSSSEMTPRDRVAGGSASRGYWTVAAPFDGDGGRSGPSGNIVFIASRSVTPRPLRIPGIWGFGGVGIRRPP